MPTTPSADDVNAVEVGVKFQSDVAGTITGIKFYKGAGNTGTHVGHLWTDTGTLLASATFSGESASGWQEIDFTTPVAISANTVYVASYHTDAGHYADDEGSFATGGVDNGVLHALADGVDGPNGVYAYGASGSFPNQTWNASNYYIDVVFNPTDSSGDTLIATAGPAQSTNERGAVTFAGSVTGGTGPFAYAWDFGDGTTDTGSLTPTHTYNAPGSFTATLTVTDALNHTSTSSTTVTVNAVAPTVNTGGPYSATPGAAVSFAGSATAPNPGDLTNATYSWTFGDGATATGQNASHTYATADTYTVTLTVKEASGLSATATTIATVASASLAPQYIQTSNNKIPNFGFKPTVVSVESGNWSDPTVWSTGKLPGTGDVVDIMPGNTVTYDVNSSVTLNTIAIQANGSLKFRPDIDTQAIVGNFEVLPGGYLEIGTAANPIAGNVLANIVIANQAIDTAIDPEGFGTGLIVLGKMTSYGAQHTPYVTLSQEAHAGDTVLHLASPGTGWKAGDLLVLPDTRQLYDTSRGPSNYVPRWEELVVKSVSADGLSVTLTTALKFNHLGARDAKGVLDFLPHVINREGSIMIGSIDEGNDAGQTRGYTLFTDRADINIQNTGFCELGRTTTDPEDDTTFGSNGAVTHIGTNQGDRLPMTILHLYGPTAKPANGYQFTLIGNVIDDDASTDEANQTHMWGIGVNDSYYGLIQNNVVYNAAGVGIGVEDGSSSFNVFDHNFVMRVNGTGARLDKQFQGDGFWFQNPNNHVTNNIATDINNNGWASYSYGFDVDATYVGTVKVAAYQGADPTKAGQSVAVNMNAVPLLEFANNELYASPRGLTLWWLGTSFETVMGNAGTVKNMVVWNQSLYGLFNYETNNLVIDGWVQRDDRSQMWETTGLYFADYMTRNCVITNADVQGAATGIVAPQEVGRHSTTVPFTIENSFLDNKTNIAVSVIASSNGGSGLSGRNTIIQNVTYGNLSSSTSGGANIAMDRTMNYDPSFYNLTVPDLVYVYNYNGIANDNFQVFYAATAPPGTTAMTGVVGMVAPI
jgi:PKD repeat protein